MPDRYWIGGAGSSTDTAHWSASSGGGGGASAPTASDNAIFDANSGTGSWTFTIPSIFNCLNFDASTAGGTMTIAASGGGLNVSGSFALKSGQVWSGTQSLSFSGTGTGRTITTAGVTITSPMVINNASLTLQALDNITLSTAAAFLLTNGSFDLNGKTLTCQQFTANAGTLTLSGGTINMTLSAGTFSVAAGVTLSALGSTINLSDGTFSGGGKSFGTVTMNLISSRSIVGANTFQNLNIVQVTAVKTILLSLQADQVVSGTLKIVGVSLVNRLLVASNTTGTTRSFTVGAVDATSDFIDFRDIAFPSTAFAVGTSIANALGNSGITFTPAVTRYWRAVSGGNGDVTTSWSTSSGGATGASVPLCHDDIVIDANSITSTGRTITLNNPRICRNLTISGVLNNPSILISGAPQVYGSLDSGSGGFTWAGASQSIAFMGRSSYTLKTAGITWPNSFTMDAPSGKLTLLDAFTSTVAVGNTQVTNGELDTNGFAFTVANLLRTTSAGLATLTFGASTITLANSAATSVADIATNTTINPGSSTIKIQTAASIRTAAMGGKTYNNVWVESVGGAGVDFTGANTFAQFKADVATSLRFTAGTTTTAADWQIGAGCTIGSITAAGHTLAKSGGSTVVVSGATISRSTATPANTFFASSSTDGGNNSGWIFAAIAAAKGECACGTVVDGRTQSPIADSDYEFNVPLKATQFRVPNKPLQFRVPL